MFSSETYESWAAARPKRGALVEKVKGDLLSKSFPPKVVVSKEKVDRLKRTVLESVEAPESFRKFLAILERDVPGTASS